MSPGSTDGRCETYISNVLLLSLTNGKEASSFVIIGETLMMNETSPLLFLFSITDLTTKDLLTTTFLVKLQSKVLIKARRTTSIATTSWFEKTTANSIINKLLFAKIMETNHISKHYSQKKCSGQVSPSGTLAGAMGKEMYSLRTFRNRSGGLRTGHLR